MTIATITSKGQITIPAAIRAELHVGSGDRLAFVRVSEGRYEIVAATQDVSNLRGMVSTNKLVSIEEMSVAIKARAAKR